MNTIITTINPQLKFLSAKISKPEIAPEILSLAIDFILAFIGDKKYITPAITREMKTEKNPINIPRLNKYKTKSGNSVSGVKVCPAIVGYATSKVVAVVIFMFK